MSNGSIRAAAMKLLRLLGNVATLRQLARGENVYFLNLYPPRAGSAEDRRTMKKDTQSRWRSAGFVVAAAMSGVLGAAASPASADTAPISITISGTEHYVNETYTITVHCQVRSTVGVTVDVDPYDAEQSDLLGGQPIDPGEDLLATVPWTPTSTGTHTIYAYGCASGVGWPDGRPPTATLPVEVTTAPVSTGSADGLPAINQLLKSLFG
ncbi:hypothetical protein [Rhodococcus aetherivorans]